MKWLAGLVVVLQVGVAAADEASTWVFVEVPGAGYYWQDRSILPIDAITTTLMRLQDDLEPTDQSCPEGMVHVRGAMLQGGIERLQDLTCLEWMDGVGAPVRRCARYDRDLWLDMSDDLATRPMDFCIDRFEFPNRAGMNPAVNVSWTEAGAMCESVGRRLCTEHEWTFACEGEEALPYPYGYERDSESCNIDHPWRDHDNEELYGSLTPRSQAGEALAALWQGRASGALPECVSPFGVYDMTGNVDEWTTSVLDSGYPSVMKGGYWSNVRNRCRPATRAHGPSFVYYQQGFRCCSTVQASFGAEAPLAGSLNLSDGDGCDCSTASTPLTTLGWLAMATALTALRRCRHR